MTQTPPISAEQVEGWRFDIQHGPEGESAYAWVYDETGKMVGTMQTYQAEKITGGMNTLKAIGSWSEGGENAHMLASMAREATIQFGNAASIPASRGSETEAVIEELRRELVDARATADDFCKENVRLTDALIAANLASVPDPASPAPQPVQEQEPVAWRWRSEDINGDPWPWDYTDNEGAAISRAERGFDVQHLFASPPEQELTAKVERLEAEIERLKTLNADLLMQAQGHAMEARTANSTIYEIYQALTGATGEPGNWHGAEPAKQYVAAAEAKVERLTEALHGVLDVVSDELGCGRHCVIEAEMKDEQEYASAMANARAALDLKP